MSWQKTQQNDIKFVSELSSAGSLISSAPSKVEFGEWEKILKVIDSLSQTLN